MAVTLNASTSTGLVQSADTSGEIQLQSNGTTVLGVTSTGTSITGTQSVSGNLSFNSGYGSSAVAYGCRAWVNFGGIGTVSIRASGNVSSITDNGVGEYTVNITTAMPDANYCYQICARDDNNGMGVPTVQADPTRTVTTTALPIIYNYPFNQLYYDAETITVAIFR